MQAVILAAGQSTRTYPLTLTRPKPLLPIARKAIIERTLSQLKGLVKEVIIVVGYKKEMIQKLLGVYHKGMKITYVEQKLQLGTGHALSLVKPYIQNRFVLLLGDDLYFKKDIKDCMKHLYAILVAKVDNPEQFGVIKERNGLVDDFVEKPKEFVSNLINTGLMTLDKTVFNYVEDIQKGERGEYELPDAIKILAQKENVHCIQSTKYFPVGYPWDVLRANLKFRRFWNKKGKNNTIKGKVINSVIGSNCVINGTVKDSVLLDGVTVEEDAIIESSVIGEGVTFEGTINAAENAISIVKGKKVQAGKFGAAIGDYVIAREADVNAGVKVWPNKEITGQIGKDVMY